MGANIIGGIGVFLSICLFIICLLYGRWVLVVLPVIFCFAYGSIFYGFHSRNAKIYWPFLITNGIAVGVGSIYILVLFTMLLVNPEFWQRQVNELTDYKFHETTHQYPRLITAIIACIMLVIQVLNIWFELVVYNASSFMRRERLLRERQHGGGGGYQGVTIIALAVFFCTVLLLDIRPQLFSDLLQQEEYNEFSSTFSYKNLTSSELRQLELALLLLLCIHWMGQSLVWHYYCYSKHFKAEEFYHQRLPLPTASSCANQNRGPSFPIAPVKRLQVVQQQSK
uniref:DUF4220 domain-containing protein n=1 Tax=Meloidogyne hapla TaxID=6305 RepID=A0A1I8BPV3_MELHA